jgi:glycosyltransferase involved in cell wall biosynthesis
MAQHILFATHYTGLGGGETALLTLAQQLDQDTYQPHLLVPGKGQLADHWHARGWPTHIIPYRGATVYFIPPVWARLPITHQIEGLIRDHDIRAVHSDYHTLPMALPAAKRAGSPILWTCMGWWFQPKVWQRRFFQRCDATFAHSEAIKRGFLGAPPFMPPERIEVLYPGVDTERFNPDVDGMRVRFEANIAQDAPVVALVARFQNVKGHDMFQDVARQVAYQIPEARFIVAGENVHGAAADDRYKQQIIKTHEHDRVLRERVTYLGFRSDVERVMAAADVVVCASQFESFGVVNVEAMAMGKPVVSTNNGGPAETIVDGETGYLVEPGDVVRMAERLIVLLRDADLRQRLGGAGRDRVERLFSATATAGRFSAVLDGLLA